MRSQATYVSILVRAHLRNVTPLPSEELAALKRSIPELRALGNNLNQMARAIHQGGDQAPGLAEVGAMLRIAVLVISRACASDMFGQGPSTNRCRAPRQ